MHLTRTARIVLGCLTAAGLALIYLPSSWSSSTPSTPTPRSPGRPAR